MAEGDHKYNRGEYQIEVNEAEQEAMNRFKKVDEE